jgi:hypothetical protein
MIFLWSERNIEHIARHDVRPAEAEYLVGRARGRYPAELGDDKYLVRGQTEEGRYLQVIFVFADAADVQADEYEFLELHEREAIEKDVPAIRVIHARDLTADEKRQLRRNRGPS